MITARNYAAQVAKFLISDFGKTLLKACPKKYIDQDMHALAEIIVSIEDSVHFALPDGGEIFNDGLKGLIGNSMRLPYPAITVEYFVPATSNIGAEANAVHAPKRLIWAREYSHESLKYMSASFDPPVCSAFYVAIMGFAVRQDMPGKWIPDLGMSLIPCDKWDTAYSDAGWVPDMLRPSNGTQGILSVVSPSFMAFEHIYGNDEHFDASMKLDAASSAQAVAVLCEALSCKNVIAESIEKVDPSKNARRIKAGKLPIYETKMLVIDANSTVNSKGEYQGGSHSSPRQHLRRGHIRRHPTAGNIWVNSCVVGDASVGSIGKSYKVISK